MKVIKNINLLKIFIISNLTHLCNLLKIFNSSLTLSNSDSCLYKNFIILSTASFTSIKLIFSNIGVKSISSIICVTSFLTLQRGKVTVLHLLDRELYCLKLTRDYVTTLTNYKGWIALIS